MKARLAKQAASIQYAWKREMAIRSRTCQRNVLALGLRSTRSALLTFVALVAMAGQASAIFIDFEDLTLPPPSPPSAVPPNISSFENGANLSGGFTSGGATFNNTYTDFGGGFTFWSGWSYSNVTNTSVAGFENQYASYAAGSGGGAGGSANYGVAFWDQYGFDPPPRITLAAPSVVQSAQITNTTYSALAMLNGDAFSRAFTTDDYFLLTINGYNSGNVLTGSLPFYLADYRTSSAGAPYVIGDWTTVDLSSLGEVSSLEFTLASTDTGAFGINTPTYFARDNLNIGAASVPEPGTVAMLLVGLGIAGFPAVRSAVGRAKLRFINR